MSVPFKNRQLQILPHFLCSKIVNGRKSRSYQQDTNRVVVIYESYCADVHKNLLEKPVCNTPRHFMAPQKTSEHQDVDGAKSNKDVRGLNTHGVSESFRRLSILFLLPNYLLDTHELGC